MNCWADRLTLTYHTVMATWETELQRSESRFILIFMSKVLTRIRHLHDGTLSWVRHHGRTKIKTDSALASTDIVLTTYETIQSDYKTSAQDGCFLFSHQWRRIILDEAHIVRNKNNRSEAVASLKAASRWAVTGTPIQNSLLDIAGLFRFLHFRPYANERTFDDEIVEYFRQNNPSEGTRRLKALCLPIMLRRSKNIIVLPSREELIKSVSFSQDERREYRRIESEAQAYLNNSAGRNKTQLSTIQLINRLRIFCNLGLGSQSTTQADDWIPTAMDTETDITATTVASDIMLGGAICAGCQQAIGIPDRQSPPRNTVQAYYSQCRQVYCSSCAALYQNKEATRCMCTGKPPCLLQAVFSNSEQKAVERPCISDQVDLGTVSSKVHALLKEIRFCLPRKKYVFEKKKKKKEISGHDFS